MTKYYYTLLHQDGTKELIGESDKKWDYETLRDVVGGLIEIIPKDYMPKNMGGTVYGHEEARFNESNTRNLNMVAIIDSEDNIWDTVGDLLLEQTQKQYDKFKARN